MHFMELHETLIDSVATIDEVLGKIVIVSALGRCLSIEWV